MRKTIYTKLAAILVILAALAATSCKKEKKCRCRYTETNEVTYVYVDPSLGCAKVTQLGYDVNGDLRLKDVTCEKVKKDDLDSDERLNGGKQ